MTQAEFLTILGPEWEVGKGKVDWFFYGRGKVSNEYVSSVFGVMGMKESCCVDLLT